MEAHHYFSQCQPSHSRNVSFMAADDDVVALEEIKHVTEVALETMGIAHTFSGFEWIEALREGYLTSLDQNCPPDIIFIDCKIPETEKECGLPTNHPGGPLFIKSHVIVKANGSDTSTDQNDGLINQPFIVLVTTNPRMAIRDFSQELPLHPFDPYEDIKPHLEERRILVFEKPDQYSSWPQSKRIDFKALVTALCKQIHAPRSDKSLLRQGVDTAPRQAYG